MTHQARLMSVYNSSVYNHQIVITNITNKEIDADTFRINYDIEKNICEIFNEEGLKNKTKCSEHIELIVNTLKLVLPKDCIIWAGLIHEHEYDVFIKAGFSDPYISEKSPLGKKLKKGGVSFLKYNHRGNNHHGKNSVIQKIDYVQKCSFPDFCKMYAKFAKSTTAILKKMVPSDGIFNLVKVNHPDNELTGSFVVKSVKQINNKTVFTLDIDFSSIESGKEEEVDAVWSRFNFHTHPKKAYTNNKVKKGWPSSQDYVGFLDLKNSTIFHTVITLEGIYIISMSSEFRGDKKDIDRKFILKHCDIDHKSSISYEKYIKKINSVVYKNTKLFYVQFLEWRNISDIFEVYYSKTDNMCLSTDTIFNICIDMKRRMKKK